MAGAVFKWQMDATAHKGAVRSLRDEITEAHRLQTPLPISIIFSLLPVTSEQVEVAKARGAFEFSGDDFRNEADSALDMEFSDPVMHTFTVTIPEVIAGQVDISDTSLKISFSPTLDMDIPRLAELGVDRSRYQALRQIEVTAGASVTVLYERTGDQRETWIVAVLERGFIPQIRGLSEARSLSVLRSSDPCADLTGDDYYVFRRTGGLCFVNKGTIEGGQLAYEQRYGPATQAECREWVNTHCDEAETCN